MVHDVINGNRRAAHGLAAFRHSPVMLSRIDVGRDLCFQGGTKQLREPRI
jgi:hypothetical protein